MAQLCIRTQANGTPTAMRTQPGDVVVVMEDSHVFSKAERSNGHYRFLSVAGVSASTFDNLTAPALAADGSMSKIRALRLNPTTLTNATWRTRTTATKAQVDSITQARP